MLALTLEFEKVPFHSEHPLELLGQEDRVMKRNTNRVMKHNPILQGPTLPAIMEGKVMWETEKFSSVQLSQNPLFSTLNVSIIFLCFPPPFVNSGQDFF
jgi:hypothetical protein